MVPLLKNAGGLLPLDEALQPGVQGYVLKTQTTAELVQAIREVSKGQRYLSPGSPT